jgi:hypothetical protein
MPKSMPRTVPPRLPAAPAGGRTESRKKRRILFRFFDPDKPAEVKLFRVETDLSLSAEDIIDAVVRRERAITRGRRLRSVGNGLYCLGCIALWLWVCYRIGCLWFS